jgi:hypothetical protein
MVLETAHLRNVRELEGKLELNSVRAQRKYLFILPFEHRLHLCSAVELLFKGFRAVNSPTVCPIFVKFFQGDRVVLDFLFKLFGSVSDLMNQFIYRRERRFNPLFCELLYYI